MAHKYNHPTIITFDQPLFWKSSKIVSESTDNVIKNIVLLLGNFHTTYNLLGCIGKLMAGSGLSDILCNVYGESTVNQMLSGKAYSRALRGHLLMDQVLTTLIMIRMYDNDEMDVNSKSITLEQLYKEILESKITTCDLQENLSMRVVQKIH